ncbi:MAG: hypothetical protein R2684_05865 [Pyrinomonadaceae bacterium]
MNKNRYSVAVLILIALTVFGCGQFASEKQTEVSNDQVEENQAEEAIEGGESTIELSSEGEPDATEKESGPIGTKSFTVKFAKGRTSGGYSNSIKADAVHTFVIGVASGQTMSVKLTSAKSNAIFDVYDPAGNKINEGTEGDIGFEDQVDSDGNYKIKVSSNKGSADYKISFNVTGDMDSEEVGDDDPDDGPSGGRNVTVRFPKGKSSASYSNSVVRGDRDKYTLGAASAQTMTVSISSVESNAVFQIRGPRGYLPGAGEGDDATRWTGELPATGNYVIIVGGTRGNASYNISFSVK